MSVRLAGTVTHRRWVQAQHVRGSVVLLGGTGYLGSRLAAAFVDAGYRVAVLKRKTSRLARLEPILSRLSVFDIEDDGMRRALARMGRVDAVVHTVAAYGRHGEKCADLLECNVTVPLRLLEAAVDGGAKTFISAGTSLPPDVSGYALAKRQLSDWGRLVSCERSVRFIDLRIEHFYGPGDDEVKFATRLARACLAGEAGFALTAGEQLRDFIYVDDVVNAFKVVLERSGGMPHGFHAFGVGSGRPISVRRFVLLVTKITGSQTVPRFGAIPYRKNEMMCPEEGAPSLTELGWSPEVSLASGLRRMIEAERAALVRELVASGA